jgi:thioredoxin reductase
MSIAAPISVRLTSPSDDLTYTDKTLGWATRVVHRNLLPGVFAIGDVRSGSIKRVAAAVGDGAQVVAGLHAFLAKAGKRAAPARIEGP